MYDNSPGPRALLCAVIDTNHSFQVQLAKPVLLCEQSVTFSCIFIPAALAVGLWGSNLKYIVKSSSTIHYKS